MPIDSIPKLLDAYRKNFVPERAVGISGTVQLNLTGEGGGDYVLTFDEGTFDIADGVIEEPTVSVTAEAGDWLDASLGNVNPMVLMMKGRIKIRGSVALATKFQSLFRT